MNYQLSVINSKERQKIVALSTVSAYRKNTNGLPLGNLRALRAIRGKFSGQIVKYEQCSLSCE